MTVQIVVLMAGRGSRFAVAGYEQSKPLIDIGGRPMFVAALESLDALGPRDVMAVVRQDQVADEQIDQRVLDAVPDARLVVLPGMTRGAAESARAAGDALHPDLPLVVLDCDLEFRSAEYESLMAEPAIDPQAIVLTFRATHPRFSFVQTDASGDVLEVAEKRAISDRAVAGAYGFSAARVFLDAANEVIASDFVDGLGEFYMSSVIAQLLRDGVRVRAARVDSYTSFGTPEELHATTVAGK